MTDTNSPIRFHIEDVYAANCEDELQEISVLLEAYPIVCMDTEYPGNVLPIPANPGAWTQDHIYWRMYVNVRYTKLIQIGFTLFDYNGQRPQSKKSWQFHLQFDRETDCQNEESIDMLARKGVPFDRLKREGIDPLKFAELLYTSGLVLNDKVTWVTYQGAYDMAYLLQVLRCTYERDEVLPSIYTEYLEMIELFFPVLYDVKYIVHILNDDYILITGLSLLADKLGVQRGDLITHQAGADSLLTGLTFFELVRKFMPTPPNYRALCHSPGFKPLSQKLYGLTEDTIRIYQALVTRNMLKSEDMIHSLTL